MVGCRGNKVTRGRYNLVILFVMEFSYQEEGKVWKFLLEMQLNVLFIVPIVVHLQFSSANYNTSPGGLQPFEFESQFTSFI